MSDHDQTTRPESNRPAYGDSLRLADPHLEREKRRYEQPLPSREWILQVLEQEAVPVAPERLIEMLAITADEAPLFTRRLNAMERDGQLMINRRGALCIVDKLGLVRGRVQGHPDGFGFLVPDEGGADLFLSPWAMSKVLHGDRAVVRQQGVDRRGRPEGVIVEVLERGQHRVVGRLLSEHGIHVVVPENKRISQDLLVPNDARGKARAGQVVVAEIVQQPDGHIKPVARIVEVLGDYGDPGMEIEIALRKHDLPYEFSRAAVRLAGKLPKAVRKLDLKGREDLRALPLVTIDGETSRDFDDAVFCRPEGAGFRLWVAIADVSHYVADDDALDHEARARGNSVYFPRRVIPMLPEKLSNDLCSLNPDVDRLCMVCEARVEADGRVGAHRFYPAVMHSHARLTYTQVADLLEGRAGQIAAGDIDAALHPHLRDLHRLYLALLRARTQRGAIDFETAETRMDFDEQGKISRIYPVERNDAHRLIEECMLAANVCASQFLQSRGQPTLYRIHPGPRPEKLADLREFLAEFGLELGGGEQPRAKDYAALLERIRGRPDRQLLQTLLLRSLQQAVYSPQDVGHFGLAYETYTHFTSPIRRYPDLLVHRAIKAALRGERYDPGDWAALGAHCSQTERTADEATRDVEAWLKCWSMRERVGESFTGSISGVAAFGVFVALDEVYVEGMIHVSDLGTDYFRFDAARHQLLGERSGRRFRLADRLQVKLVRADLETTRLDFVLAQDD